MQVFITGNANKLKEVKAILAAGGSGIEVTSQAVDGELGVSVPVPRICNMAFVRNVWD